MCRMWRKNDYNTNKYTPNHDVNHFSGWAVDICGYTKNYVTYYPSTLSQETTREIILTKQQLNQNRTFKTGSEK